MQVEQSLAQLAVVEAKAVPDIYLILKLFILQICIRARKLQQLHLQMTLPS